MDENLQFATSTDANATSTSPIPALTERMFIFLEDSNWESANNYCERILDIEPTNAIAYLGKLMSECKVNERKQLGELKSPLNNNANYQKIMSYGDEELKNEIKAYNESSTNTFNTARRKKKRRIIITASILSAICVAVLLVWLTLTVIIPNVKYNNAVSCLENGDYENAISIFDSLDDFKDSKEQSKLSKYKLACDLIDSKELIKAHDVLKGLGRYKDSRILLRNVSWELIYEYLENGNDFKLPIETSLIAITATNDQIMLGYNLVFDDSIKVDVRYVASINKDGTVMILGVSNCSTDSSSVEQIEAMGTWNIEIFEKGDPVNWDTVDANRTGFFQYTEESMLETFTDNAFESMIIGLQTVLLESETGVTLQDIGFYAYE